MVMKAGGRWGARGDAGQEQEGGLREEMKRWEEHNWGKRRGWGISLIYFPSLSISHLLRLSTVFHPVTLLSTLFLVSFCVLYPFCDCMLHCPLLPSATYSIYSNSGWWHLGTHLSSKSLIPLGCLVLLPCDPCVPVFHHHFFSFFSACFLFSNCVVIAWWGRTENKLGPVQGGKNERNHTERDACLKLYLLWRPPFFKLCVTVVAAFLQYFRSSTELKQGLADYDFWRDAL